MSISRVLSCKPTQTNLIPKRLIHDTIGEFKRLHRIKIKDI
jgi:hypothetical protein